MRETATAREQLSQRKLRGFLAKEVETNPATTANDTRHANARREEATHVPNLLEDLVRDGHENHGCEAQQEPPLPALEDV